ncbi:MAG TPA: hypothetical protein VHW69_02280 [Rhizomicrobium sp.]|nr:hypothetical protein [Rhizomicrobium sp.]
MARGIIRIAPLRTDVSLSLLRLAQERPLPPRALSPASSLKRQDASQVIHHRVPNLAHPEANNAVTLPLDLSTDADAAAQRQADQDEYEKRRRNLAGPSESQLQWWKNNAPLIRDYHLLGDTERAEGGELITWVDDKCYFTTNGITTFGMPQTSKVCKDPPKSESDLFKDMRKKLDEGAKGRAP